MTLGSSLSTNAVEEVGEEVDDLVGDHDMPHFNFAENKTLASSMHVSKCLTYKLGCPSCHMPTPADDTPRAILAEVKILPAHANHPVRYEAKFAYFGGASSFAQKYCPPALGYALASSENVIPTDVEMNAIHGIP